MRKSLGGRGIEWKSTGKCRVKHKNPPCYRKCTPWADWRALGGCWETGVSRDPRIKALYVIKSVCAQHTGRRVTDFDLQVLLYVLSKLVGVGREDAQRLGGLQGRLLQRLIKKENMGLEVSQGSEERNGNKR